MELVDRLTKEGAIREQKLREIRRLRDEQLIEEVTRLANTRHTNKASVKQYQGFKSPPSRPSPPSPDLKRFSAKEAHDSCLRLMSRPEKPTQTCTHIKSKKASKERVGEVVARLYPKKTLSACHSEVRFGRSDHPRTQTAPKLRPCAPIPSIKVTEIPLISILTLQPMTEQVTFEMAETQRTPATTAKDCSDSPNRGCRELATVDSPNLSSISNHIEEESFTRLTAFDAAKLLEKPGDSEPEPGGRRPVSLRVTSAGGIGQRVTVPMAAYRFVVGMSEERNET